MLDFNSRIQDIHLFEIWPVDNPEWNIICLPMWIYYEITFNSSPLAAYNIRMSEYIHKRYNVTVLLYHLVFPAKYRRAVVDENVDETIRDVCLKIEDRYQLKFLEIGTDEESIRSYVQNQGKEYTKLHDDRQLALF